MTTEINVLAFPAGRMSPQDRAECLRVGADIGATEDGVEYVDLAGAHLCRDGLAWVVVINDAVVGRFRELRAALSAAARRQ
jgi:hypothetical protein